MNAKILLRYIHAFRDRHGRMRYYFRRPGFKRVPLPGLPGSEEFMSTYQRMLDPKTAPKAKPGATKVVPGTFDDLIVRFYSSVEFADLKSSTQATYRSNIEPFRLIHGSKRVVTLQRDHIKEMLKKKKSTPSAANNWLKRMRQLLAFAVDVGMRSDNPTIGIKLLKIESDGHPTWSDEHIEAFRRKHPSGSRARLALEMGLCTMQRKGDLVRMGRQHIQNGVLAIRQQKTGTLVEIPVLPELQAELDQLPAGQMTFLQTSAGAAFTAAGFGNLFADWAAEAGLPKGYNTHGLRKAGATRGADALWTDHEIMAWGGWKSISEVQNYTKAANRRRLAKGAVHKLTSRTSGGKPE